MSEKLDVVYPFKISRRLYEVAKLRASESDRTVAQHLRYLLRVDAEQHGHVPYAQQSSGTRSGTGGEQ